MFDDPHNIFSHSMKRSVLHSIVSTSCEYGGNDYLYGGNGTVDYIVAGGFDDYVEGNEGKDLVFGDHAFIELDEITPYMLKYATTTNTNCTPGNDTIYLGSGDDLAFGGGSGDIIFGEDGQDIVLGDFGLYDTRQNTSEYVRVISTDTESGGDDNITLGSGDDVGVGGAFTDKIYGEDGMDILVRSCEVVLYLLVFRCSIRTEILHDSSRV